MKEQNKIN